ncbi:MAG: TRAP transporter substrate-binding protein [Paracoccus sp. (in: a-proteobacteria)]|uniref:TRAP transporter substrate-binding protein n=1 Tax=Paracoccus sp. TaxID=267 RepID=UPI0026E00CB9|nr:TRAP transporter substrate-binding protein [Paracoccus sp. (in: a-proteobacteria)]MDO5630213.1 TRAP transporter substrate-binding protein [Paracoccus sp. (in: a-proteobacteria)]
MTRTVLAAILCSTAFAGAGMANTIILAHAQPPGNPRSLAADFFAEKVAACTEGRITVSVAGAATMGDDVEALTSTSANVIQITANSQGATAQIVPELNVIGLPFLFADAASAWEVIDGDIRTQIDERAQNAGLKLLAFWDNGIRHVSHLSKSIETPEDFRGVKIRTPPDDMTIAIFNAFGANPAPLTFAELPTALQSGVFEAQENPLTNIYSSKLHEITKYISLTGHKYETTPLLASMAWWAGLSPEDQACVQDSADEATTFQRQAAAEQEQEVRQKLEEEGAIVTELADRQAFVDATSAIYDEYRARYPELVDAIVAASQQ